MPLSCDVIVNELTASSDRSTLRTLHSACGRTTRERPVWPCHRRMHERENDAATSPVGIPPIRPGRLADCRRPGRHHRLYGVGRARGALQGFTDGFYRTVTVPGTSRCHRSCAMVSIH